MNRFLKIVKEAQAQSRKRSSLVKTPLQELAMLSFKEENTQDMIRTPELVAVLETFANSGETSDIKSQAFVTLSNLSHDDKNLREMFRCSGLLATLVKATKLGETQEIQLHALTVLSNLSFEPTIKPALFFAPNVLDTLVGKATDPLHVAMQRLACKAIYSLSASTELQQNLRNDVRIMTVLSVNRNSQDEAVSFWSLLALVNVVGAEEEFANVLGTDLKMLTGIVETLKTSLKDPQSVWRLSSPLRALRYLCVVDSNRILLFQHLNQDFLSLLIESIERALVLKDPDAAELSFACLNQFSFDEAPLAWLRENALDKLLELVSQVEQAPVWWSKAMKVAQGFRFQLELRQQMDGTHSATFSQVQSRQVMISYQWESKPIARMLDDILTQHGFSVWRDERAMKADVIDAMADGVQSSQFVIVVVTKAYKQSGNCKIECKFALNCGKKIIPVLAQEDYHGFKSDAWLGAILGSLLYYDLTQDDVFEQTVLSMIHNEMGGGEVALVPTTTSLKATTGNVPEGEANIQIWLQSYMSGDKIARVLIAEELVEGKDIRILQSKSHEQLQVLLGHKGLNTKNIFTLKDALQDLLM